MKLYSSRVKIWIAVLFAACVPNDTVFAQQENERALPGEENAAEVDVEGEGGVSEKVADDMGPDEEGNPAESVVALFDQLGAEAARDRINAQQELIELLADDTARQRVRDHAVRLYTEADDPEVWHRVREVLKGYVSDYSDFGPRRGFLGVLPSLVEYPSEDGEVRRAVRIEMVVPDTPAAKAKLRSGDLILKINDVDLNTPHGDLSFFRYTYLQDGGKEVKLKILRDWKIIEVDAVLMSRPIGVFANQQRTKKSPDELLRGWLKENNIEFR